MSRRGINTDEIATIDEELISDSVAATIQLEDVLVNDGGISWARMRYRYGNEPFPFGDRKFIN